MICILGDKAGVPTGVPYFPQQRHEPDSSNYGYFDLKKNLGLIDRIPELRDRPEIRSLVEELNSSSGPFRSIGCDAWDLPDQPRPSEWISRGYVQVAFETLQLNNREEWISLFNSINSSIRTSPTPEKSGLTSARKRFRFGERKKSGCCSDRTLRLGAFQQPVTHEPPTGCDGPPGILRERSHTPHLETRQKNLRPPDAVAGGGACSRNR